MVQNLGGVELMEGAPLGKSVEGSDMSWPLREGKDGIDHGSSARVVVVWKRVPVIGVGVIASENGAPTDNPNAALRISPQPLVAKSPPSIISSINPVITISAHCRFQEYIMPRLVLPLRSLPMTSHHNLRSPLTTPSPTPSPISNPTS